MFGTNVNHSMTSTPSYQPLTPRSPVSVSQGISAHFRFVNTVVVNNGFAAMSVTLCISVISHDVNTSPTQKTAFNKCVDCLSELFCQSCP